MTTNLITESLNDTEWAQISLHDPASMTDITELKTAPPNANHGNQSQALFFQTTNWILSE